MSVLGYTHPPAHTIVERADLDYAAKRPEQAYERTLAYLDEYRCPIGQARRGGATTVVRPSRFRCTGAVARSRGSDMSNRGLRLDDGAGLSTELAVRAS
jgi:hypothetical protein